MKRLACAQNWGHGLSKVFGDQLRGLSEQEVNVNGLMTTIASTFLLLLGLMLGAALFFVFMFVMAGAWLVFKVRQLGARWLGREPKTVWQGARFDPRHGFRRAYAAAQRPGLRRRSGGMPGRTQAADVTDVTPRPPAQ